MSIIDTDKTSDNRSTPELNTNDSAQVRKAHNTYGNTLRRVGSAVKQFMRFGQGVIDAKDADGNRSFFLGYEPTISSRPVIRIAKDGFDALTASDSDLIFNSENNVFKIVASGSVTNSTPFSSGNPGAGNFGTYSFNIATIAHGLSYTPAIIAYAYDGTSAYSLMPSIRNITTATPGTTVSWTTVSATVDSTNVYITYSIVVAGNAAVNYSAGAQFKYYLLQETAN